jgi:hypothetical protein
VEIRLTAWVTDSVEVDRQRGEFHRSLQRPDDDVGVKPSATIRWRFQVDNGVVGRGWVEWIRR